MTEAHDMSNAEKLESAFKSERWFDAVELGEKLIREKKEDSKTLIFMTKANAKIGNHATGLLLLESLHESEPGNTDILIALTRTQVAWGDAESALRNFASITAETGSVSPKEFHQIRLDIGNLMLRLNRLDELAALLDEWHAEKRQGPRIASLRCKLTQARGDLEKAAKGFAFLTKAPKIADGLRLQAFFDLSKVLDRLGRYDEAFEAARQANEHPAASRFPFDRDAYRDETDRMIRYFTAERFERMQTGVESDESPVFIIGMPRSGTTLTEQMIAAHPDAAGIGEQREPIIAGEMISYLTGTSFPECIEKAPSELLSEMGGRYLRMSRGLSNNASRVTNKALGLDRSVGLIQCMLPGSRIIFVRRNPLDTLLSVYLHPLQVRTYPWSRSIEDIIFVRREFDRLVDHWMKTSRLPMFDLEYEHFTRTQAETTHRILEFLDLPPSDECLQFHESKRYVKTPSYDQVNKPLNQNAIERWRNYEKHLGPAIEAFGS